MSKAFEEHFEKLDQHDKWLIRGAIQAAWNAAMLHAAEVAEAGWRSGHVAPLNPTEIAAKLRVRNIALSITHTAEQAMAMVILED